ncbi:MAG: hypothetical protein Unbinned3904contig1002_7 [Prokaryotic dsDNA virus sp.]|nr:MAG: hypothetical protein Unbinned3904contig1002_7 [Prokaryotic dsDNA virus sp.]|tara:strand:+ start:1996 stop:2571 length:576 start_codon:yes stop_codon:yes gene_type:complete
MAYILLISEQKLKESTAISQNLDTEILLPYVRQAQKIYVESKLGTKLTDKLKDLVKNGTLGNVGNENYKTLVDDYIGDMLPNWAFYHAVPFLRFKVENGNIYSKTSETGVSLTTEESQHLREEIRNTAEYYTERMIDYVRQNISFFPEYNTNTGADVDPDPNAYYNGMNLEKPRQGTELTLRNFLNASDYS